MQTAVPIYFLLKMKLSQKIIKVSFFNFELIVDPAKWFDLCRAFL